MNRLHKVFDPIAVFYLQACISQENTFMNEYHPTPLLLIIGRREAIKNLYMKVT